MLVCAWNTALLAVLLGHNFHRKKSQQKAAPLRTVIGLTFAKNKNCSIQLNTASTNGFKTFWWVKNFSNKKHSINLFNLSTWCLVCGLNLAKLKWLVIYKFERKRSNERAAPLRTLEGLIFAWNKNHSKYSVNQSADGFRFASKCR